MHWKQASDEWWWLLLTLTADVTWRVGYKLDHCNWLWFAVSELSCAWSITGTDTKKSLASWYLGNPCLAVTSHCLSCEPCCVQYELTFELWRVFFCVVNRVHIADVTRELLWVFPVGIIVRPMLQYSSVDCTVTGCACHWKSPVASPAFVGRRGKDGNYVMGHSRRTSGPSAAAAWWLIVLWLMQCWWKELWVVDICTSWSRRLHNTWIVGCQIYSKVNRNWNCWKSRGHVPQCPIAGDATQSVEMLFVLCDEWL